MRTLETTTDPSLDTPPREGVRSRAAVLASIGAGVAVVVAAVLLFHTGSDGKTGLPTAAGPVPADRVAPIDVSALPADVLAVVTDVANKASTPPGTPWTGGAVLTTRQNAQKGDTVDSNQPVWDVDLHGSFSVPTVPGGAQTDTLYLVIDAKTLQITDLGVVGPAGAGPNPANEPLWWGHTDPPPPDDGQPRPFNPPPTCQDPNGAWVHCPNESLRSG